MKRTMKRNSRIAICTILTIALIITMSITPVFGDGGTNTGADLNGLKVAGIDATLGTPGTADDTSDIVAGAVSFVTPATLNQANNVILTPLVTGLNEDSTISWYISGSFNYSTRRFSPVPSATTTVGALAWKPISERIPAVYNKTGIYVKVVSEDGSNTNYYKIDISVDSALLTQQIKDKAVDDIDAKDQSDGVFDANDVSFQVYTIRDLFSGATQIPGVTNPSGTAALDGTRDASLRMEYIRGILQTLYDYGYRRIEPYNDIAGNYNSVTSTNPITGAEQVVPWLTASEWHTILNSVGNGDMKITGWHLNVPGGTSSPDVNAQAKDAQLANFIDEIGLNHALIAYAGFTTQTQVDAFMNNTGDFVDAFSARDIKVDYHIHNHELQQATKPDGTLDNDDANVVLNTLLNRFDNAVYKTGLELDINWASRSGRDVLDIMDQFSRPKNDIDRLTYLHIKDVGFTSAGTGTAQGSIIMEEQGAGTLDLPSIIAKGMDYNVKYFAVEQDSNFVPFGWPDAPVANPTGGTGGDSMLSSKISMDYLRTLFGTKAQVKAQGIQRAALPTPKIKDTELVLDLTSIDTALTEYDGSVSGIKSILLDVKDIGYKNVQLPADLHGLTAVQWKSLLNLAGLKVTSAQIATVPTGAGIDALIETLNTFGTKKVYFSNKTAFGTNGVYTSAAAVLTSLAKVKKALKTEGITLGYRITNKDFAQKANGDGSGAGATNQTYAKWSAIDDLAAAGYSLDLDTFWTGRSSRTVRDEVDKYASSIDQISLQDLGITWNIAFVSEELYEGHLNLDSIISAANAAGVKSYVVTQEANWFDNDPLASAKRSYDTLKAKGVLVPTPTIPPIAKPQTTNKLEGAVIAKIADQTFTGKALAPAVKVTVSGKTLTTADYAVAYTNNTKIGTATVTITGKGAYAGGSKTATFKVVAPKVAKLTGVKIKAAKKAFTLSWKKASVTGYQIKYTTDKKFKKSVKTKTIKKNTTVKYTVKKLKKGKTYYVKIRAYKKVANQTFYGSFSKLYKVKIK